MRREGGAGCLFVALCFIPAVILASALALAFWMTAVEYDSFVRQCAVREGHLYQPDSITFCLTDDGRFVEVYP